MAAPVAVAAGRFAWIGYKDRLPFVGRRSAADEQPADVVDEPVAT
jgi:hypothetical protein